MGSGLASISYKEALDEALCVGWIDGVRRSLGDTSYTIRFTPRRAGSIWSAVNLRRYAELEAEGRVLPAGRAAREACKPTHMNRYSFEQETVAFEPAMEARFRAHEEAWAFFAAQPKTYRKTATWHVISAKKEETRERRLADLIDHSARGLRLPQFVSPSRKKAR